MINKFMGDELDSVNVAVATEFLKGVAERKEGFGGTYIAGTFTFKLHKDQDLLSINIKPIDSVDEEFKEACYYASKIYIRAKSETAAFYNTSMQNVKQYETMKKFDDFMNGVA